MGPWLYNYMVHEEAYTIEKSSAHLYSKSILASTAVLFQNTYVFFLHAINDSRLWNCYVKLIDL